MTQTFLDNYNNNQFNNNSILNPNVSSTNPSQINNALDPSFRGSGILNNPTPNIQPMSSAGGMRTSVGGNGEQSFLGGIGDWITNQFDEGGLFTSKSALGSKDAAGWLSGALGAGQAGFGIYTGYEKLKLGKDQLAFNKTVGTANINNQTQDYNRQINERYSNNYSKATEADRANMLTPEQYAAKNNLKGI